MRQTEVENKIRELERRINLLEAHVLAPEPKQPPQKIVPTDIPKIHKDNTTKMSVGEIKQEIRLPLAEIEIEPDEPKIVKKKKKKAKKK